MDIVKKGREYEQEIIFTKSPRVFNSKKVESHSAIIPTYKLPKNLSADEQVVYNSIVNRFIMQFMPIAEHEETVIITKVVDVAGNFVSKGKVQKVLGFKKVEQDKTKEVILPDVKVGEAGIVENSELTHNMTKAPKPHTEKTLLRAMETCGRQFKNDNHDDIQMMNQILSGFSIGTPATRAETIKKLCTTNYAAMNKKNIHCTEKGRAIIEALPVKELMDLEYTGKLEKTLSDIEKGIITKDEFLEHIKQFVIRSVEQIKSATPIKITSNIEIADKQSATKKEVKHEVVGKCPLCQNDIVEGERGFGCLGYKSGCGFVIWKDEEIFKKYNKKVTKTAVKGMLKKGKILIKGFKTVNNTKFDAIVSIKGIQNNQIEWKFEKP
ncbi:MAG: hypothetical protein BEN19_04540 [Epulopiscium sp. Nuni2H_MBin003]|nr:MAG: hypothetical protein BEN19_04540 [Epulopiscium sp. Nuni2H_MBin003]